MLFSYNFHFKYAHLVLKYNHMNALSAKRQNFLKKLDKPLTFGFAAVADFTSYIGQEYIAGIMQAAADYGINLITMAEAVHHSLMSESNMLPQFLTKMQFMRAPLLDGLVTWASSLCEYMKAEKVQELFSSLAPLPMVDIGYLDIPGVPCIRIDNSLSMHHIVKHLVEVHGFSRFAFIGSRYSRPHLQRLDFYRRELENFSLPCDENSIFLADSLDAADIAEQVEFLLQKHTDTQVIVTSSDIIASQVIIELEKRGLSVPDDIAVTGYNNQLVGVSSSAPITTINLVYFERGYQAVELLIDLIMQPEQDKKIREVGTTLIVRQSCGCFEDSVLQALHPQKKPLPRLPKNAGHDEIAAYLIQLSKEIFPQEAESSHTELAKALAEDLCTKKENSSPLKDEPPKTLIYFRRLLKKRRTPEFKGQEWEESISRLRAGLIPLLDQEQKNYFEDICNALRTLHAFSLQYDIMASRMPSQTGMTHLALSLANVESIRQLENALTFKLSELRIPGIVIALSPYLTERLSPASVEIVIPGRTDDEEQVTGIKVREPHLFPKSILSRGRRFSVTLELLFHSGYYIGYVYLFSGGENLAFYDDVKELLSQTLYKLYKKEGKIKPHALIITDRAKLAEKISLTRSAISKPGKMQAKDILDYLIDHLDEMCDLDKMAAYFSLSRSHLTRRVKALTGHSIQSLHEILKIEQAKDLIKSGNLKMNDIAARLGYTNPNYFSNVFKKVTGLSPLSWAERNRH